MKRVEYSGMFFRTRRGRLVRIPDEWIGRTTHPQTIRKRKVRARHKKGNRYEHRKFWDKDFVEFKLHGPPIKEFLDD